MAEEMDLPLQRSQAELIEGQEPLVGKCIVE